jgi:hypothetical protein
METIQIQLAANVPFRFFKVRAPAVAAVRAFRDEAICRERLGCACAFAAAAAPAATAPRRCERCPLTYLRDMYREAAKRSATPPRSASAAAYVPIRVIYGFEMKNDGLR